MFGFIKKLFRKKVLTPEDWMEMARSRTTKGNLGKIVMVSTPYNLEPLKFLSDDPGQKSFHIRTLNGPSKFKNKQVDKTFWNKELGKPFVSSESKPELKPEYNSFKKVGISMGCQLGSTRLILKQIELIQEAYFNLVSLVGSEKAKEIYDNSLKDSHESCFSMIALFKREYQKHSKEKQCRDI